MEFGQRLHDSVALRVKVDLNAAQWRFMVHDHLGSTAVITDASGAVLERLMFDPWG